MARSVRDRVPHRVRIRAGHHRRMEGPMTASIATHSGPAPFLVVLALAIALGAAWCGTVEEVDEHETLGIGATL